MSTYLVGDIHGCYDKLKVMLAKVKFNPKIDTLWLTGDIVSRGPDSLKVLRLIRSLNSSVRMVLGNHDLKLLSVYAGIKKNNPEDHITSILKAPDADKLINWLRYQPILQIDKKKKLIMSHAGITPQWNLTTANQCAHELETILKSKNYTFFLANIQNKKVNNWSEKLKNFKKVQFIVNAFTEMRYCFPNGQLEIKHKDSPKIVQYPLYPWFLLPRLIPSNYSIVFGHWSSLIGYKTPPNIYAIDTGCCWGGKLTLLCWENKLLTTVS